MFPAPCLQVALQMLRRLTFSSAVAVSPQIATKRSSRVTHKRSFPLGLLCASVITMIILVGPTMTGAGCPTGCNCSPVDDSVNSLEVKCSYLSLSDLPKMFNLSTVNTLDLSNNELSTLKNASFSSYTSLSILILSNNKLEKIEINAFAGLRMMKEIDLSYNKLESLNSEIFSANPVLNKVTLRGNRLAYISSSSPILISTTVSILDLSFCSLTSVSSVTFSRLPNLYSLDLSSNLLQTISVTTFEKLQNLSVLKLNNNRWTCSCNISEVMQWLTVTKPQKPAHKPVKCWDGEISTNLWTAAGGSQLCGVSTTTEARVGRDGEVTTDMSVDQQTVSGSVPQSQPAVPHTKTQQTVQSPQTSAGGSQPCSVSTTTQSLPAVPHKKSPRMERSLETSAGDSQPCNMSANTEALVGREGEFTTDMSVDLTTVSVSVSPSGRNENKTGDCDSLLCWDVNTLTVVLILPLSLALAVFLSLIAVKYFWRSCKLNSPQHETKRKDGNRTGFFSRVPLLHPQLTADVKNHAEYVSRSSESLIRIQNHVYEEIN